MNPLELDNLITRAHGHALAKEWPDAMKILQQAYSLAPNNYEVLTSLGISLVESNLLEESLPCFVQAVALMPESAEARTNLGVAHHLMKKAALAITAFQQALEKDPEYAPALKLMAGIRASEADHVEARKIIQALLKSHPQDWEALLFWGRYLEFDGNLVEAKKTYRDLLGWYPNQAEAHLSLTRIELILARKKMSPAADPSKTILMLVEDRRIDRRVLDEARSLGQAGWQVTVVAGPPLPDNPLQCEEAYPEIEIVRTQHSRHVGVKCLRGFDVLQFRIMKSPLEVKRLARYWNTALPNKAWHRWVLASDFFWEALERPAAVYVAHDMPQLPNATIVSRYYGSYLVYDAHEFYPEQIVHPPKDIPPMLEMDAALSKGADLVITVNESIAQEMRRRYLINPEIILNCPSGLSTSPSRTHTRLLHQKLKIPPAMKILLYQGNLTAKLRNLESAIHAMSLIQRTDVALVLMGPDYWNQKATLVEVAVKYGVMDRRVFFHDYVRQMELLKYTREADVGIIPYLPVDLNTHFCTPNKLFEYLVAELPILATDLPELNRFVSGQGVGLNRPLGTPEQIAGAVDEIFAMDLSAFKTNLRKISERFVWKNHEGPKVVELYQKMTLMPPKSVPVKEHIELCFRT